MKAKLHQILPTNWNERENLREKGQFWTPSWVAEAMVAYVSKESDLIFDPATGNGAFLEALLNLNKKPVSFYGTDVDENVLKSRIYQNNSCKIELRDFIKTPPNKKFNAIVANPPYKRHHRIDFETKQLLKQLSQKTLGFTIDGRAGYHIYFLIQALDLLEDNGRLAFIMPADTCEGTFAKKLWKWITDNYLLECVVTFDKSATPFPNVDTNAIVFFIKKSLPKSCIYWVKANQAYSTDILRFVQSGFQDLDFSTLEITERTLSEALESGLSRPKKTSEACTYRLADFAKVMRGIATGANEFFFLTKEQVQKFQIPQNFLKTAIGRTKDIDSSRLTKTDIENLNKINRPTCLLSINGQNNMPLSVANYIKIGEDAGLTNRALIKQRKPWYKMEQRKIPPILFAYLGRRNLRFIKNEADALPLTGFLCVYSIYDDDEFVNNLWQALNHPETIENLKFVGKSYGSGAIKVEPRSLEHLQIPNHIVEQFNLVRPNIFIQKQPTLFD
jgi:adenine-specific DNA-methyltransferase